MRIATALCLPVVLLTGCSVSPTAAPTPERGLSIRGNVHGGQQPIIGAHVYLFAANTTGYGQPSVSTLSPSASGAATDSIGTYVTTDTNGAFSISNDYTCTANTQLYLYALGGDPGAGPNPAAGELAVLGQCPASGSFASSVPFVTINEVTTIAAAYAMAGFATDATHVSSSGTPLAQTGITNAFANASNLANISTGTALNTTPAGNGTVPQTEINTLANILAACINSTGPSSTTCSALFTNAQSIGSAGTAATDTATAAINIAHNPASNIAALYALPTANAPFAPALSRQPLDFSVSVYFRAFPNGTCEDLAIDAQGNVWMTTNEPGVLKLNPLGAVLSPGTRLDPGTGIIVDGYADPTLINLAGLAIDTSGNVWVIQDYSSSYLYEFNSSGQRLASVTAPNNALRYASAMAIDQSGNLLVPIVATGNLIKFASDGTYLSSFAGGGPPIAVDAGGNIWTASSQVTKYNNQGTPAAGSPFTIVPADAFVQSMALDSRGNLWALSDYGDLGAIDNTGTPLQGSPYVNHSIGQGVSLAIDGQGNAWLFGYPPCPGLCPSEFGVSSFDNSGAPRFGGQAIATLGGYGFAIDGSGNVWVGGPIVTEIVGAAAPVVTPLSAAVKNNAIATRP